MSADVITVRAATGMLRVAVLPATVDHPFMTTVTFVRGWNVFVNGERSRDLWVGQTSSGALCGLIGSEIVVEESGKAASTVAYYAHRKQVERAHRARVERLGR